MIYIDFETRSEADLKKVGAYKYSKDPTTDIYCMAWSTGDEIKLWVPGNREIPDVTKEKVAAWNVTFDYLIWNHVAARKYGFPLLKPKQVVDVMAKAAYANLPLSLNNAAQDMNIGGKLLDGLKALNTLKKPKKKIAQEALNNLYAYCMNDVAMMIQLDERMPPLPEKEQAIFQQCLRMNLRGVPVDEEELKALVWHVEAAQKRLNSLIGILTDGEVESVTQVIKLRKWLEKKLGMTINGVDKKSIKMLLAMLDKKDKPVVKQVLKIRQQIGLTSNLKYKRALDMLIDGRIHDHTVYYGAATGREAGRGIQLQNLKRTKITEEEADSAIANFMLRDEGFINLLYGPEVLEKLSELVRSIIKAPFGKKFVCADFSSIENVAAPWLTGEKKLLDAFIKGLDQYKISAADMFGCTYEQVDKDRRQAGKITCLACQYAGGYRALMGMAENYGLKISEKQARKLVTKFRIARPKLTRTWHAFGNTALDAIFKGPTYVPGIPVKILFREDSHGLHMELPSGRDIIYPKASKMNYGAVETCIRGQYKTFSGANFFQNAVQAICRDLLMEAKLRLEEAGYPVIISVHDEVLCEVPDTPNYTLEELVKIMTKVPKWAKGLPIRADGWEGRRYRK